MSQRVHPAGSLPADQPDIPSEAEASAKLKPQAGTYVIQVPKDQIYRVPPPENADRFEAYSRAGKRRHRGCCCCLAWIAGSLFVLLIAIAATLGILYLVFQPKLPKYSVEKLAVTGFNLTSGFKLSPEFDVTVRADNPNKKIGIYYRDGSSITVSYSDVTLCQGVWPTFYQGRRNVTVFQTPLKGSGLVLSIQLRDSLVSDQTRRQVPLEIDIKEPVRVKFGAVTSWTITVKVRCQVTVDKLTADSRMVSNSCSVKVDL